MRRELAKANGTVFEEKNMTTPSGRKRKLNHAPTPAAPAAASTASEAAVGRRSARNAKSIENDADGATPSDVDGDDVDDSGVDSDVVDDDSECGSRSSLEPPNRRRGRPRGSKNRPRDPDAALAFDIAAEEHEPPPSTERLTQRQRALLLQEGEEELMSLPNRPAKTKNPLEMTEEQLARKQAANERRRINEKERMEKEKSDTIQKLLTNAPVKKADRAAAAAAAALAAEREPILGAIPAPARIRAARPNKKKSGGVGGDGPGVDDDVDDEDDMGAEDDIGNDELAAIGTAIKIPKYNRSSIVARQYLEIEPHVQHEINERHAKRAKRDAEAQAANAAAAAAAAATAAAATSLPASATAGVASTPASVSVPPVLPVVPASAVASSDPLAAGDPADFSFSPPNAVWRFDVSFPLSTPLPDAIFPLHTIVGQLRTHRAHMAAVAAAAEQNEAHNEANQPDQHQDDNANEADEEAKMEIDQHQPTQSTPAEPSSLLVDVPAPASISILSPIVCRSRPACARASCGHTRRYTDAESHLPICSLECLKQIRNTDAFHKAVATAAATGKTKAAA